MMIFLDPPDHTKLRGLVSRAFTPRRISGLDERIRGICADLLDPLVRVRRVRLRRRLRRPTPVAGDLDARRRTAGGPGQQRLNVDGMFHIEPGVGMHNEKAMRVRHGLDRLPRRPGRETPRPNRRTT